MMVLLAQQLGTADMLAPPYKRCKAFPDPSSPVLAAEHYLLLVCSGGWQHGHKAVLSDPGAVLCVGRHSRPRLPPEQRIPLAKPWRRHPQHGPYQGRRRKRCGHALGL